MTLPNPLQDLASIKLLHRHEGDWIELHPTAHGDVDASDPERRWNAEGFEYACEHCGARIRLIPGHRSGGPGAAGQDAG
ncbi:MAG TPA: hypothetical protein VFW92_08775 [Candidatus Limnocylindrales bacterium]|nr:hypothetical protein [Candidatus Limnocylindrales bacterium]